MVRVVTLVARFEPQLVKKSHHDFDVWGRFRYSDLKEAALFAADAMGFQSTLVWKLLERRAVAWRCSNQI
jgi:hypothetical protein